MLEHVSTATMEALEVESCIHAHHVYKEIWSPTADEELPCVRESSNTKDPYAVAVTRKSAIVGHVSRKSHQLFVHYFYECREHHAVVPGTVKYLVAMAGPFSAAYFPIFTLLQGCS